MTVSDHILDVAWSDIGTGTIVRWRTPNFIKYGRVLHRKDRSLTVQFTDDGPPRAIPDARWYYVQFKQFGLKAEESLCVLKAIPVKSKSFQPATDAHEDFIHASQVAEYLNWDEKQVRRYIRRGTIPAFKDQFGRWVVRRGQLIELAGKHGWV